jgi:electron transfer flavoprotein alpha subunit
MSNILVFVEARDGAIKKPSLEAMSLARDLAGAAGGEVHALLIGSGVESLASEVAQYGAAKVHVIDSPELALYTGDGYAAAMESVLSGCGSKFVLAAHSAMGKDLLPRVAAKQGAGMVSDATGVSFAGAELEIVKPVYAGKAFKKFASSGERFFVTLRPNTVAASEAPAAGAVEKGEAPVGPFQAIVKEVLAAGGDKVPLAEAQVVVSGGRGLKGPEHFSLVEELAAAFGPGVAAVGASRAVCRRRLASAQRAGRPDRQGRRPDALHRARHLRRDPAPRRHAHLEATSSRSTRTPKPRSSRSPTTASSATSSKSSPS